MKRLALALLLCLLLSVPAPAQGPLDNPDGYYSVTPNGIEILSVQKRDDDGNCMYVGHIVHSPMKNMPQGQLSSRGWWLPSTQQFLDQSYMVFASRPECNGWWKAIWGHQYVWDGNMDLGDGRIFAAYRKTHDAPDGRQPEPRCTKVRIQKYSCDAYCAETTRDFVPAYLVKDKNEAIEIFRRIR